MASIVISLLMLFAAVAQVPKNDPNGVWEADGGTRFELHLSGLGQDLQVRLVPGSNPLLVAYEVELKNLEEANTYAGKGFFIAKVKADKECKFEVDWSLIVANNDHIVADIPQIIPNPDTCEVQQRVTNSVELVKK